MARTSARVELIGQQNNNSCIGGCCSPTINDIKVDRTFPQILEYYKTVDEWTETCQKFDKAFRPMNNPSHCCLMPLDKWRVVRVIGMVMILTTVPFFILIGEFSFLILIFLLIVLIVSMSLGVIAVYLSYMLCRIVYKQIAWQMVRYSLRKSCSRESEINESVSFYLRQEKSSCSRKYYIECILEIATNSNASDVVESGMILASIPVATVVNDGSVYTEAVVASAQVISAPVASAPVARAQVDGSAENWDEH